MTDIEAQVVRIFADSVRASFGELLARNDEPGEMARTLVSLAYAVADCATATAATQKQIEEIARAIGVPRPAPPKLRLIRGNRL